MTSPDPQDLQAFTQLLASPIRTPLRETALADWSRYKLARQAAHVSGGRAGGQGKQGAWTKGAYIASLTAPAIDLRGAVFTDVCLGYADLRGLRLDGARFELNSLTWTGLKGAQLQAASLRGTHIAQARLMDADLRGADLSGAQLAGADLSGANLAGACLHGANLRGARLQYANLVGADLRGADLSASHVYGASVWDAQVDAADGPAAELQRDLVVTPDGQAVVTVDRIEVAQFIYLLLSNPKIRDVIDTVCDKAVLILGRFSAERLAVLHALRDALRQRGFVPIVFDFDKPRSQDVTETVKTLAGLSRFIVSDMTNPRSNPLELQATVPDFMVPMVPILAAGEAPFAMFRDLWLKYPWVLDPLEYGSTAELLAVLDEAIIAPALARHAELLAQRSQHLRVRRAADYLPRS
jgi:uncharacterized protein YjbI with pentapeptide repeats